MGAFQPLHHLRYGQEGRPLISGWKTQLYHALYTNMSPSLCTPPPPCDGHDWGSVFGFGFSVDGSILAAACEKRSLLLYDPVNMRLIMRKSNVHTDCVNCVRFLDNRLFATCSDDHTVRLWDMRNLRQEFRILRGHTSWVKNIEYAQGCGKLVTSGFDGNIFSWDINNYSDPEGPPEPILHISGIMRTVLTAAEDKMIISTLGGYFVLVHNLNLRTLKDDMLGFKPNLMRIMQVLKVPLSAMSSNHIFTRDRNRVEYMGDFPATDNAESISTMEVHPHGWCVASRNTTPEEDAEWTCVHDIQASEKDFSKGSRSEAQSQDSERASDSSNHKDSVETSQGPPTSHVGSFNSFTIQVLRGLNRVPSLGRYAQAVVNDLPSEPPEEESDLSEEEDDYSEPYFSTAVLNEEEETIEDSESSDAPDLSQTGSSQRLQASESQEDSVSASSASNPHPAHLSSTHSSSTTSSVSDTQTLWPLSSLLSRSYQSNNALSSNSTRQDNSLPFYTPLRTHLGNLKPRLLYYLDEPNVGVGFIKEQSFSSDGRILASPYKDRVRLLAFTKNCEELCDCVPKKAKPLVEVGFTGNLNSTVLASAFSPTQLLLVAGSKEGSISFCAPKL